MISTVILTHNNRETLPDTLESVSWTDECIIIDDYSTDDTVAIARDYNATVYKRHLDDDFAAQRNFGLGKANHPWVFFVDSDEIVTEDLKQEIHEKISQQGESQEGTVGFFLRRTDIFLSRRLRHGETASVRILRLAKKTAGTWIRPVHEIWDVSGPTEILQSPLIHAAHTDVAQFVSDINRYTTINADYLYQNHARVGLLDIVLYPIAKYIQNYVFRAGFLDGTAGFVMAMMMSMHSFLTRAKLYMRYHTPKTV